MDRDRLIAIFDAMFAGLSGMRPAEVMADWLFELAAQHPELLMLAILDPAESNAVAQHIAETLVNG